MYDLPKKRYHGLKITDHVRRNYAEHIRSLKFNCCGGLHSTPELPSAWDNTAIVDPVTRAVTNRVADVQDQGQCGSCVAFGTCAAIESAIAVAKNIDPNSVKLSELDLFSNGGNCTDGWDLASADAVAQDKGIVAEKCWPYGCSATGIKAVGYDTAPRTKTASAAVRLSSDAEVKAWLVAHGAVQAAMDAYDDLSNYKGGVYTPAPGSQVEGGHCVCIVGYDDAAGCWKIKNSWGALWGEQGFFRIAYGECGIIRDYVAFGEVV